MKFKVIIGIDTELYEKEFGVKITDPDAMVRQLSAQMVPPGTKSMTITVEK